MFATLTKTAGVCANSSQNGTARFLSRKESLGTSEPQTPPRLTGVPLVTFASLPQYIRIESRMFGNTGSWDRRSYGERRDDKRTYYPQTWDGSWEPMADSDGFDAGGSGILRVVVLAAAEVAGVYRGGVARSGMAMGGGSAFRAGICSGAAVRLGLRLDGARDSCPDCAAEAARGRGILPVCAESNVPGVRDGVDWVVGRVWARVCASDPDGGGGSARSAFVCGVLRGADAAQDVWGAV